jgi:hypothetical protein
LFFLTILTSAAGALAVNHASADGFRLADGRNMVPRFLPARSSFGRTEFAWPVLPGSCTYAPFRSRLEKAGADFEEVTEPRAEASDNERAFFSTLL